MLMKGSERTRTMILSYILLELSLLISFIKGGFLCHDLVYTWCWITSSTFYRQLPFREHSLLPAIFLLVLVGNL